MSAITATPYVLLVNPDLGHHMRRRPLQGYSTKKYGHTEFSRKHGCHIVRLTPKQYEDCVEDVRRSAHLPLMNWRAEFIVELDTPEGKVDVPAHEYIADLEALKNGSVSVPKTDFIDEPSFEKAGLQITNKPLGSREAYTEQSDEVKKATLDAMHRLPLYNLAHKLGIDTDALKASTPAETREFVTLAILEKQATAAV